MKRLDRDGFVNLVNDESLNMSNLSLKMLWIIYDDMKSAGIILLDRNKVKELLTLADWPLSELYANDTFRRLIKGILKE